MKSGFVMVLAAGSMVAVLGGCVTDGTTASTADNAPAMNLIVPEIDATTYAARQDGPYAVPAVAAEKVPAEFQRQVVDFPTEEAPGTVIINPAAKQLHLILGKNRAIRYGIAVGKAGFQWSGEALVTNRKPWPTWTPPKEMIERKPELAKWEDGQPGGPTNPLGARALYLTTNGVDYGYRIHGTPEWQSIGRNASSGCIRMINQDVMDLYDRVPAGAKVIVLNADGSYPQKLTLPPPQPKKVVKAKPVTPKPVEDPVAIPAVGPAGPMPLPPTPVGPAVPTETTPTLPVAPAVTPSAPVVTLPTVTAPKVTTPTVPTNLVPEAPTTVENPKPAVPLILPLTNETEG